MPTTELSPQQLRRFYISGTLKQRYHIACQRFDIRDVGPSTLVNAVSALEGFSRAVAVQRIASAGTSVANAHAYLRNVGLVDLIEKHICPAYGVRPASAFGGKAWKQIPEAVAFRNVLVHEAAFLNGDTCRRLTAAAFHCLERLAVIAGAV